MWGVTEPRPRYARLRRGESGAGPARRGSLPAWSVTTAGGAARLLCSPLIGSKYNAPLEGGA